MSKRKKRSALHSSIANKKSKDTPQEKRKRDIMKKISRAENKFFDLLRKHSDEFKEMSSPQKGPEPYIVCGRWGVPLTKKQAESEVRDAEKFSDLEPMIANLHVLTEIMIDIWLEIEDGPGSGPGSKLCVTMEAVNEKAKALKDFYHEKDNDLSSSEIFKYAQEWNEVYEAHSQAVRNEEKMSKKQYEGLINEISEKQKALEGKIIAFPASTAEEMLVRARLIESQYDGDGWINDNEKNVHGLVARDLEKLANISSPPPGSKCSDLLYGIKINEQGKIAA
ncbi:MAG: hypothetical protein L6Q57_08880 [Alphaproteobacteria bacterium]|nr:hypothetical protein [Alphaproteobacteria bacterium]